MWMYIALWRVTQTDMFCVVPHVCYFAVCILNKGKLHEINFELYQLTSNETCKLYLFVWTVFRHCLWNHCCTLHTRSSPLSSTVARPACIHITRTPLLYNTIIVNRCASIWQEQFKCVKLYIQIEKYVLLFKQIFCPLLEVKEPLNTCISRGENEPTFTRFIKPWNIQTFAYINTHKFFYLACILIIRCVSHYVMRNYV